MSKVTSFFTELMRKYLPDPFVFAIGLTLFTLLLALVVQHQGFLAVTSSSITLNTYSNRFRRLQSDPCARIEKFTFWPQAASL